MSARIDTHVPETFAEHHTKRRHFRVTHRLFGQVQISAAAPAEAMIAAIHMQQVMCREGSCPYDVARDRLSILFLIVRIITAKRRLREVASETRIDLEIQHQVIQQTYILDFGRAVLEISNE